MATLTAQAQTTYEFWFNAAAPSVGTDGNVNVLAAAGTTYNYATAPGGTNQFRAPLTTGVTLHANTERNRIRHNANWTGTTEVARGYTPALTAANNAIAASATGRFDMYMRNTGTGTGTATATLYEYNDTTGVVGAAKGTATAGYDETFADGQSLSLTFSNAAFTATVGNRLVVYFSFTTASSSDPALLYASNFSATRPAGHTNVTFTMSAGSTTTTTVGDGTNPGNVNLCPGGAATMLDAFTLQTDAGTEAITGVTVTLAAGTFAGISLVEITDDTGGTVYGSVVNPGSATVAVTTAGLTATTTSTQYKVRITPRTHPNMPVPPGATYAVTGTVTAITSAGSKVYSDSGSATVTIDNLSPANPAAFSGVAGDTQVALSWTNPGDVDFSEVIILRRAGAAVADTPVEGATYVATNTIGASTVVYAGAGTSFTDTGLTNGTAYYYRIFAKDTCGNYSTGAAAGPYTPNAVADVAITKTVSPGSVPVNQDVTFTITVTNGGPSNATNVTVTDSLPTGLTYVSATPSQGSCSYTAPTVTCNLGTVNNAGTATISLVATGNTPGTPTNTASVTATENDPSSADNSSSVMVRIQPLNADISVVKTADLGSVGIGGALTYTLTVTNLGPDSAGAVSVTDTIPAGMSWVSSSPSQGTCSGTLTVICDLGLIAYPGSATVTIAVTNDSPGTKSNTATVRDTDTNDFDPDTTNNSSTVSTSVTGAPAVLCATPGQDGPGGTLSGIVNRYYPGTANVAAGATCIPVGTPTGAATPIASGNLLLVIQMQDADINSSNTSNYGGNNGTGAGATTVNAGKYEYVNALGAVGGGGCAAGSVPIAGTGTGSGLLYNYTNAGATGAKGQMRFQVIRVPQYTTATLSNVTAAPWTTNTAAPIGLGTGGVLAIDIQGAVTLSSGVAATVDGLGFRGGAGRQLTGGAGANTDWRTLSTVTTNGSKGEGIGGTPEWLQAVAGPFQTNQPNDGYPNGSMGRGAPANAGGGSTDGNPAANDQNSGGGGGSNGGAGGTGGYTWSTCINNGGRGAAVTPAITKLVLGGGGGGGTRNNNPGDVQASGGAAGGGLMVIRAAQLTINSGAILSANGADAYSGTLQDGGGGGGAGGSVILTVTTGGMSGLTVRARGGAGGSDWLLHGNDGAGCDGVNLAHHGPGGGGGGGVIVYTNTTVPPTLDVSGGANGVSTTDAAAFGAQPGGAGQLLYPGPGAIPGASGAECTPDPAIALAHTGTTVSPGGTVDVIATVTNAGPFVTTSGVVTVVITLDSALTGTGWSGTGWSCSITNPTVTCTRTATDALAAQASFPPITIAATVGGSGPATLTNTATVSNAGDVNTANNAATDSMGIRAPTLATLGPVRVVKGLDGTVVSFRTAYEVSNLGFRVIREDGGVAREMNASLLAGSALFAGQNVALTGGRSYRFVDTEPLGADTRYSLQEIDLTGRVKQHGPFFVEWGEDTEPGARTSTTLADLSRVAIDVPARPGMGRERRLVGPIPASTSVSITQSELAGMSAAKIPVSQEGWYRVTKSALLAAGYDPGTDVRTLQLFAETWEQAIVVSDGGDGSFDAGDAVEFYGTGLDTPATDARVYWLVSGRQSGLRVVSGPSIARDGERASVSFPFTAERRDRTVFFAALTTNGDRENFFGAVVGPDGTTVPVATPGLVPTGNAVIRVSLQGATQQTHQVEVSIGGVILGTITSFGTAAPQATFTVDAATVAGSANVTLRSMAGSADFSAVDTIRVTYPHAYAASNDLLAFSARPETKVSVSGFTTPDVRIVDVTNADRPVELPVVVSGPGTYTANTVTRAGGGKRLLAFTAARVPTPTVAANAPSSLGSATNAAAMVVVGEPSLLPAASGLAAARTREGLPTTLVDVDDVYDEFSFGEKDPAAIRSFLLRATSAWATGPRYVLLLGDASIDPRNYLGFGKTDLVPTKLVATTLMKTASDDWFGDFSGTGVPGVSLGRLPARTLAEASAMIGRVLLHDENGQTLRTVLVAADSDGAFDFDGFASQLAAGVPAPWNVLRISATNLGAGMHAALVQSLNAGPGVAVFVGHGSEATLGFHAFFDASDAAALTNGGKLPIFVGVDCLNGYFHDVYVQSISESLLKAPNGGAVAAWVSSTLTEPEAQISMMKAFVPLLFSPKTRLGDVVRQAKPFTTNLDVRRSWNLLGDPAMRVH